MSTENKMSTENGAATDTRRSAVEGFAAVLREFSPSCLVADAAEGVAAIGGLRTVDPRHRVAGPALTVDVPPDTLVDVLPVLGRARPGDVVVIACQGNTDLAMWGGIMTTLAQMAGIAGVVVDGAIRDVDELREMGFPAWYRGTHPRRCPPVAPGDGEPVRAGVPVRVGEALIRPGDIVVADENGVSVVPVDLVEPVLSGVHRLLATEATIRAKINAGMSLSGLLAEFGHL